MISDYLPKSKPEKEHFSNQKSFKVSFYGIVIPCTLILWYASAILFPPSARTKYSFLLWDDGQLTFDNNKPILCPRPSICSEGVLQIICIAVARLTAYGAYVFIGATFLSKMHCLIRFLSSTYIRRFIPFETLHHMHTNTASIFGGLILVHASAHYVRYILRGDVGQLSSAVHISGLTGLLALLITIGSMSRFMRRKENVQFEKRFNSHWIGMVVMIFAMCYHHPTTRVVLLSFS